ncbi:Ribosome-binding factor a [Thalictrum thalictroides]|uniref:Ribosome-binding factor a n=1 Tax=Thalictrum thalictroides TaxID=46969 RepID=A0A7J6UWS8_THATH|nr:Ribosome-binding factor a [Thalictrum thalictroides]
MAHATPLPLSPLTHHHHHFLQPTILHRKLMVVVSPLKSIYLLRGPLMNNTVRCMANPRRVKMVAKQIQREISDMLLTDKVLQCAILPEAALGADRYLSSLTTISEVEVSADLQVVKVYVSVFGDERGKELAIAGLKSKAKYVRHELGRRIKLRLTPEVRFIEDESLERGSRVIAILDRLKDEKKTAEGQEEVEDELYEHQDDRDSEADDPDEDIIYVN